MTMRDLLRSTFICLGTCALATAAHAAQGDADPGVDVSVSRKGLRIQTGDGSFKFKAGGRLHFDAAGSPGDLPYESPGVETDPTDGVEIRRGRIALGLTAYDDWDFFINVDFADDQVAVKDLLLAWRGLDWARFTVGSQKQPYSVDLEESSNDMPFVERGIDNALIVPFVDRALGGRIDTWGDDWHFAFGAYGDGIDPNEELDDGWGVATRAVYAPIHDGNKLIHLGFRSAYREPTESDQTYRVRTETTHFSDLYISDTGGGSERHVTLYGPEAMFAWGPASFWGEYNRAEVSRQGLQKAKFQSGYVAAAFTLTGESRAAVYSMKEAEFKRIQPENPFRLRGGGIGAWEVAARYAYIDLNDAGVNGGIEGRLTTALNWYPNYNVRFMFDWTRVMNTEGGSYITQTAKGLDILTFRAQIAF